VPIRAVGFDLDDTLAVPARSREEILRIAVDAADGPHREIGRRDYLRAHGRNEAAESREPIFADLLAGHDADPAAAAAAYREATAEALVPVPGARELVERLREEYAVGLLTDGPVEAQRSKLAALGWTELFDAVVITGDLGARKPRERAFRALLDDLGAPPETAAYVGDRVERDVHGASDLGMRAVQVLGPDGRADPRADATVRREAIADELPGILAAFD